MITIKNESQIEKMRRAGALLHEVLEALHEPLSGIVSAVKLALEQTPPELVADISRSGITLTGGGCLVYGFDQLIQRATGIPCHVADDAILCVALGCGKSLKWIDEMQEGTINLARRKLMAE